MAPVTVTFEHAVYDTFSYKRGAELGVDAKSLRNHLIAADKALDRSPGHFFTAVDDSLVFGFERNRTDEHSRNNSMAYFDLFVADLDAVADVPLPALRDRLRDRLAPGYAREVTPTVRCDLPTREGPGRGTAGEEEPTPGDDGADDHPSDGNAEGGGQPTGGDAASTGRTAGGDAAGDDQHATEDDRADDDPAGDGRTADRAVDDGAGAAGVDASPDDPTPDDSAADADGAPDGADDPAAATDGTAETATDASDAPGEAADATGDGADDGAAPPAGRPEASPEFVASFWERYRRNSVQLHADLAAVDRFVAAVDGSLGHLSFVSESERLEQVPGFDVVGTPREGSVDVPEEMLAFVASQHERDDLAWGTLPTYRDELQARTQAAREEVSDAEALKDDLYELVMDELFDPVEAHVERHESTAGRLFDETYSGDLAARPDDDGSGLTSRVSSTVTGVMGDDDADEAVDRIVERADPEVVDERVAELVFEELQEALVEEFAGTLDDRVLDQLRAALVGRMEEEAEALARSIVEEVDAVKRSRPYAEAENPDDL